MLGRMLSMLSRFGAAGPLTRNCVPIMRYHTAAGKQEVPFEQLSRAHLIAISRSRKECVLSRVTVKDVGIQAFRDFLK